MRTILFFATALLALGIGRLSAQTEKADWLVGGQLALNTVENTSSFVFSPNAGYFALNGVALGATLNVNLSKAGNITSTQYSLGPFARWYFGRGFWRPFLNAGAGFATERVKIGSASSSANGFNWLLGGGLAWFVTDNAALELTAGYNSVKLKNFETQDGLALRIGFQIYLDRYDAERMGIRNRNRNL